MPKLFQILRSHKRRSSKGVLASSSTPIGTEVMKKNHHGSGGGGGIFRSIRSASTSTSTSKKVRTSTTTAAEVDYSHPTIEAAITYTLSDDENAASCDIVFSPKIDIENQVSKAEKVEEEFLFSFKDNNDATTTAIITDDENDNLTLLFNDKIKTTATKGVDDDDVERANFNCVESTTLRTTATVSKRTSDDIVVMVADASSDSKESSTTTVNNNSNIKNKRMQESEETLTFTHLEIMRNELAHMMEIANKDKDIHRLKHDADEMKLQHDEIIESKDVVITKIRTCLTETELALFHAQNKLSNEKQAHTKTVKLLMKTQHDYHELKNSSNSWSFPALFSVRPNEQKKLSELNYL